MIAGRFLLVCLGGAIGTAARYLTAIWAPALLGAARRAYAPPPNPRLATEAFAALTAVDAGWIDTLPDSLDTMLARPFLAVLLAIVLAVASAHAAEGFPSLSAVILNGGVPLHPSVAALVSGLGLRLPMIATVLPLKFTLVQA